MKFSLNCRTKKLEMIYTILGALLNLNWKGVDIRPQIRLRKIPVGLTHCFLSLVGFKEGDKGDAWFKNSLKSSSMMN